MPAKLDEASVKRAKAPAKGDTLIWDAKVTGFGIRIFAPTKRHPDGLRSFFLNYRLNGTERRYKIGRFPAWTVAAARKEAEGIRKRIDRGEDPTEQRRSKRNAPTVQDLAIRYRAEHLPKKSAKSQHDDWQMIENYILPFKVNPRTAKLAERKVAEIHDGDMRELHRRITDSGHPTGANRVLAVASKMFSLALQKQAGEASPWRDASLGNPCRGVARNSEESRTRFFSVPELAAISEALDIYPVRSTANCIRFIMLTGCRPGEAMKATWTQVDEEPGFWIKPAATTKQRKTHKLPLGPAALELLQGIERKNKWVFPGQKDGEPIKQIWSCWGWVRERASVTLRKAGGKGIRNDRAYDLRHSFASIGLAGGLNLSVIGKLLGHSQARTTQIYAHLADEPLRLAANQINAAISNGNDRVRR
jgi:integrase